MSLFVETVLLSLLFSCTLSPDVSVVLKVGELQDFSTEPRQLHSDSISVKRSSSSGGTPLSAVFHLLSGQRVVFEQGGRLKLQRKW